MASVANVADDLEKAILNAFPPERENIIRTRLEVDSIGATMTVSYFLRKAEIVQFLSTIWENEDE